jgi:hypothetical protein
MTTVTAPQFSAEAKPLHVAAQELAAALTAAGQPVPDSVVAAAVPPAKPAPTTVEAKPDTRLAQLSAQYDLAKAEVDKATETLKAITDGIKAELVKSAPGASDVRLDAEGLDKPLRLQAVVSRRVDSARLKAEQPQVWADYSDESTSWRLERVRG